MTSNVGSHLIQENMERLNDANREQVLEQTKNDVLEVLKQTVRPEFLNRIDDIIMFHPLTKDDVHDIVVMQLAAIQKMLQAGHVQLDVSSYALEYLVEQGYDPTYGARPVKRVLQRELVNELSKQILAGAIDKNKVVKVDYFGDGLTFANCEPQF
jgi:ATP-dependent Clp protease ATP-binding subunit ClpB